MRPSTRFPDAPGEDLPRELVELGRRIAALPQSHAKELGESYTQVVDCVKRRRRILTLVQEALSQLRLDIKYLMFDLEVTREERNELRSQLDENQRDDFGNSW
ncbi:MAG: transcriptional regulator [Planctomycetaceae bacterium]|nr:transcriptional regulator [Planctomycetaceae bacterium]